jgi:hypothetical protein
MTAAISAAIPALQMGAPGSDPVLGHRIEVESLALLAGILMKGRNPSLKSLFGITLKLAVLLVFWYVGRHGSES